MLTLKIELSFNETNNHALPVSIRINGATIPIPSLTEPTLAQPSFTAFMNGIISSMRNIGQIRTSETYQSALNSFLKFHQNDIAINEITPEIMKHYERYLLEHGLAMNTISFYMRILRASYNRAVEREIIIDKRPFKHVYTGIPLTRKRCLDIQAIKAIKNYQCNDWRMRLSRDLFMFSFYTHGMSFIDMAYLHSNAVKENMLKYQRRKTGQVITIRWEECMQDIVSRYKPNYPYLLPIIQHKNGEERNQYRTFQRMVNACLKDIGKDLNLHINLTMYVARHSWANIAYDMGSPIEAISQGMGHSNERTTKIYLKTLAQNQVDDINKSIIKAV
ncbi:MAG: site-specific integrase [Muribaculaceae bacterium]|nr:site-specific integrase [Muribaculaceae bacterium]